MVVNMEFVDVIGDGVEVGVDIRFGLMAIVVDVVLVDLVCNI